MVAAGSAGRRDDALLVTRHQPGTALAELDADHVDDAVLDDAWHQLALLRRAQIAKGGVRTDAITVTPDGHTVFEDFSQASYPAPAPRMATDAVDLLAGTADVVGVERAAAAAHRVLGQTGSPSCSPSSSRAPCRAAPATSSTLTGRRWPRCGRPRPLSPAPRSPSWPSSGGSA